MSDLTYKQIFAKEIGLMFKHGLKEPMKSYTDTLEGLSDEYEPTGEFRVPTYGDIILDCHHDVMYAGHSGWYSPRIILRKVEKKEATKLTVAQICEKLGYEVEIVKEG